MTTKTRTPERTEFLNDLLDTAIGFAGYWATFTKVEMDDDGNYVEIILRDNSDEPVDNEAQEWTVTLDTMARGLYLHSKEAHFVEQCYGTRKGNGLSVANRTNGEEGDYDAIDADAILQVGLFGKVIYG